MMILNIRNKIHRVFLYRLAACLVALSFPLSMVHAQNNAQKQQGEGSEPSGNDIIAKRFDLSKMPSMFFTYWQHQAILDAKNSRGVVRAPTQAELDAIENGEDFKPDPGIREISLSGIAYRSEHDWTIWLNGQRITPSAVPKEVLDLRVYKEHIEVKWLDEYKNRVYPIRLRAHQRFNLDTRIFLSGN